MRSISSIMCLHKEEIGFFLTSRGSLTSMPLGVFTARDSHPPGRTSTRSISPRAYSTLAKSTAPAIPEADFASRWKFLVIQLFYTSQSLLMTLIPKDTGNTLKRGQSKPWKQLLSKVDGSWALSTLTPSREGRRKNGRAYTASSMDLTFENFSPAPSSLI